MAITRFIDIKVRTKSAERNVDRLDKKTKALGRSADSVEKSFGTLSKVALAVGSSLAVSQITKYADAYTSLQNQLRQTVKTTEQLTSRTAEILALSNRTRSSVTSTAESFTQLTLATEALNLTDERRLRLTETIAKSFTVAGKTQAQATESTRQLNQAFSSGVLRGQEYNTIIENAPEIFRALQRSTGKTAGELRKLADTGKLSSAVLIKALDEAAITIDEKFNASTATMAQNLEVANNNLIDFIGSSTTVQNVVGGAGGALVTASENLDAFVKIAILTATIFAARLIPATIAYTQSIAVNTVASLTQEKAHIRVGVAATVTSGAMIRATIATTALTAASRLLSVSMAFLGGPLGVIIVAAVALSQFTSANDVMSTSAEASSDSIKTLARAFDQLSSNAQVGTLIKLSGEIEATGSALLSAKINAERANKALKDAIGADASLSFLADKQAAAFAAEEANRLVEDIENKLLELKTKQFAFQEGTVAEPEVEPVETTAFANQLALETEQLRFELELRQLVRDDFLTQEEAAETQRFVNKSASEQARFDAALLKLGEDEVAKEALRLQFREQQALAEQIFQQNLTDIELEASFERIEQAKREAAEKEALGNQLLGTAVNLGASLLKNNISNNAKSEKEKKRARKKAVIIDTAAGISLAFATNPYPAALGIAAAIAATGIANLATISSASGIPQSSGGADQGFTSTASTSPTPQTPFDVSEVVENTALTRVIEALNDTERSIFNIDDIRMLAEAFSDAQTSGQV